MHRQLAAIVCQVSAVLGNVDEASVLKAAHVILQLGVGVAAGHHEANTARIQAIENRGEAFGIEGLRVGEEGAIHIDGDERGLSLHVMPFWLCYPVQGGCAYGCAPLRVSCF